jgi:integrase
MATINKHISSDGKTTYRVRIRLKGYPIQTATFERKTDANKWIQATESAIREGRHFKTSEARKHTFGEMIDRYIKDVLPKKSKQIPAQLSQLNRWKAELGSYVLADITVPLIVECRDKLGNEVTPRGNIRSPATVVRYMAALSHAFTIAVNEWEWLANSPMGKVGKPSEPRGRVRFLDSDERQRLLLACKSAPNKMLYLCVVLAIATGMRKAELMNLRWADVCLQDGYLILHQTKNGDRRRVPVSGRALELLNNHSKDRRLDTDLLFPSNKNSQQPIDLRKPWTTVLNETGIIDFHWHDLRHCFASYLAMNGASLTAIAELLGHKTLEMVKRYAHLSEGHVSTVSASMNATIFQDM